MQIKDKHWQMLAVAKLVPADWNYKDDDPEKAEKLKNNMMRNGQVENILVRKLKTGFYEVINGNHRLTAFKEIGWKQVVVYNFGTISDGAARRIAVETNETRFETNDVKLARVIGDMIEEGMKLEELAETMPFDEQYLEDMQELLKFDWTQFDEDPDPPGEGGSGDGDGDGTEEIDCPHCGKKIYLTQE